MDKASDVSLEKTEPAYGTLDQASHRFGLSRRTIYRLAGEGRIHIHKARRRSLVSYRELENLIRGEILHAA